jgi:hypothetical protein
MTPPLDLDRRGLLRGIGALGVVPAALALAPAPASAAPAEPECLADLIESGVVSRADLVAR